MGIDNPSSGELNPTAWKPANFRGTWDNSTEYEWGDAVRADNSGTWQLYISLVDGNTGNDPTSDHVSWQDVMDVGRPVNIEGIENPLSFGAVAQVEQYDLGAPSGGTFNLDGCPEIAYDADEATIQTAMDAWLGAGKSIVTGDAPSFTIERVGSPLTLNGDSLVDGDPSQSEITALVQGGFIAPRGSTYMQKPTTGPLADLVAFWIYDGDAQTWGHTTHYGDDSGENHPIYGLEEYFRDGAGDGFVGAGQSLRRGGYGAGYVDGRMVGQVVDHATGNVDMSTQASIADQATGEARAVTSVSHHALDGGTPIEWGPVIDDTATPHLRIAGPIPTTDPAIEGDAFIDGGAVVVSAGGAPILAAGLQRRIVDLTTDQVQQLASSPVIGWNAPGSGKVIVPVQFAVQYKPGSHPFRQGVSIQLLLDGQTPLLTNFGMTLTGLDTEIRPSVAQNSVPLAEDENLYITASGNPGLTGSIDTSHLGIAGQHYFPGDVGTLPFVALGGADAEYAVVTVDNGYLITGVDQMGQTFVVAGDQSGAFANGNTLTVIGSTGNDGSYTVVTAIFVTDHTDIVVTEAIPDGTVDGGLGNAGSGNIGRVATYHLTDAGDGFEDGIGSFGAATSGVGTGFKIWIDTITPTTDGQLRVEIIGYEMELL